MEHKPDSAALRLSHALLVLFWLLLTGFLLLFQVENLGAGWEDWENWQPSFAVYPRAPIAFQILPCLFGWCIAMLLYSALLSMGLSITATWQRWGWTLGAHAASLLLLVPLVRFLIGEPLNIAYGLAKLPWAWGDAACAAYFIAAAVLELAFWLYLLRGLWMFYRSSSAEAAPTGTPPAARLCLGIRRLGQGMQATLRPLHAAFRVLAAIALAGSFLMFLLV